MSDSPFLSYGRHQVDEDDIAAVSAVLRGTYLTQGPTLDRFEAAVAERVGAKFAVAVTSGTAALHIACLAAGVGPGDAGVTQPNTFVATANSVFYCGGSVTLADIDGDSLNMDPASLSNVLAGAEQAKIVLPVLFAGLAHGSKEIRKASGARLVVEDASHALGAHYEDGAPVGCGKYADMSVFSFHPVKPVTSGEGGMVVTNDAELARRLRLFRNHGIERSVDRFVDSDAAFQNDEICPWYYEPQMLGFNYRMTDIQAALGLSQLDKLDKFVKRRREIATFYDAMFAGLPHMHPLQTNGNFRARSSHHLYVAWFDFAACGTTRTGFMKRLHKHRIGSQVHYIPLYSHPWHRSRLPGGASDFPAADHYYQGCLSLPLYPGLTDEHAERVVAAVTQALGS